MPGSSGPSESIKPHANITLLKPDYSHSNVAEKSDRPQDWLLHPTGYVFQFDAQKAWEPDSEPSSFTKSPF